jgi:hypothetical protein
MVESLRVLQTGSLDLLELYVRRHPRLELPGVSMYVTKKGDGCNYLGATTSVPLAVSAAVPIARRR